MRRRFLFTIARILVNETDRRIQRQLKKQFWFVGSFGETGIYSPVVGEITDHWGFDAGEGEIV